jgi:hypothetical protein
MRRDMRTDEQAAQQTQNLEHHAHDARGSESLQGACSLGVQNRHVHVGGTQLRTKHAAMATTLASHQKLLARFSGTQTVDVQDPFWCVAMLTAASLPALTQRAMYGDAGHACAKRRWSTWLRSRGLLHALGLVWLSFSGLVGCATVPKPPIPLCIQRLVARSVASRLRGNRGPNAVVWI